MQTAGLNLPTLSIRMIEADPLRVFFPLLDSWENLFLISSVKPTDVKKIYCLEAYPNPEGIFTLSYFSSKPTLKLPLGGFLPWSVGIGKKQIKRKI